MILGTQATVPVLHNMQSNRFQEHCWKTTCDKGENEKRVEEQGGVQAPTIDWKNKGGLYNQNWISVGQLL